MALMNPIDSKPARKIALRSSVFVMMLWGLSGCEPSNVRPETAESTTIRPPISRPAPPVIERTLPQPATETPAQVVTPLISIPTVPTEALPADTYRDPVASRLDDAQQALSARDPTGALDQINSLPLDALPESQVQEALRLKESAFEALELPVLAIQMGLEQLARMPDPMDSDRLSALIDKTRALPPTLQQLHRRSGGQLAGLIDALALGPVPPESAIARWQRRYPNHLILRSDLAEFAALRAPTDSIPRITVVLPFTGPLGPAGRAVRDGLIAAWVTTPKARSVELSFVDSTTLPDDQLAQLVEGLTTDLIIGPLDRQQLLLLARQPSQIPILGLNRLPQGELAQDQLFQLALAIEDDATSAIEWASQLTPSPRVLGLVSDTTLGDRAATALIREGTAIGGSSAGIYVLNGEDNGQIIADALGVTASETRRQELSRLIGLPLTSTPRTRKDLTAVVVQSDAQTSRQIRPLLTYYYLEQTPVFLMGGYSTAIRSYGEDLANSSLLVTPWDLGTPLKTGLATARPEVDAPIGALMALGADALNAAIRILRGETLNFAGETGYLSLNSDGVLTRQLHRLDVDQRGQLSVTPWSPRPINQPMEASERAF